MTLEELNGKRMIRRLRNSLTLPYALLLVATLTVFVLLFFSANRLNEFSVESSHHLFNSVIKNQIEVLGKITKDYSYWNEAVERIIIEPDQGFIEENLLGPYLVDTFSVSRVVVLRADASLFLSILEGERESTPARDIIGSEIQALVEIAMNTDMTNPEPATGILWIDDTIFLVAVGAITPSDESETLDIRQAYGFLILAQPLNDDLLNEWSEAYRFQQLKMSTAPAALADNIISHPVSSPLGRWITNISWLPEKPGDRFLDEVVPWVLGLFALMIFVSTYFVKRVRHYTELTITTLTQLQDSRQQLNTLAYYDAVTGLPNRSLAMDRLQQSIAASRRLGVLTAVLYIDLDGFKQLNDTRGHDAGDQLLRMVGQRMQKCIREEDTAARMGGDEFCIILQDLTHIEAAETIAIKLQDAMCLPFIINGDEIFISASIGIIVAPTDGTEPAQLLQHADIAMYQAKHKGRNCYQYFTTELNDRIQEKATLQSQMRNAQHNSEFSLVYQPIKNITKNKFVGAEALIRCNNKDVGEIQPSNFIPLAENSGMIVPIGEWVLRKCLQDAKEFYAYYGPDFFLSINVSGRQLSDRFLVDLIKTLYHKNSDELPRLHLEITEGYLIEKGTDSQTILNEISDMGVSISIDDFGTGYSSLSYIHQFPIDTLKIDQSFVHSLKQDGKEASLVIAIITIAQSLNLSVIAEGVETEEQYQFLRQHGCELIQGYYCARPVPKEQLLTNKLKCI